MGEKQNVIEVHRKQEDDESKYVGKVRGRKRYIRDKKHFAIEILSSDTRRKTVSLSHGTRMGAVVMDHLQGNRKNLRKQDIHTQFC